MARSKRGPGAISCIWIAARAAEQCGQSLAGLDHPNEISPRPNSYECVQPQTRVDVGQFVVGGSSRSRITRWPIGFLFISNAHGQYVLLPRSHCRSVTYTIAPKQMKLGLNFALYFLKSRPLLQCSLPGNYQGNKDRTLFKLLMNLYIFYLNW